MHDMQGSPGAARLRRKLLTTLTRNSRARAPASYRDKLSNRRESPHRACVRAAGIL